MKKYNLNKLLKQAGSISLIALFLIMFIGIILLSIYDLCRIFVVRTQVKNTSDSISLALAQNLLFFDEANIYKVAVKIAENSDCNISRIEKTYDSINVEVSKILDFSIIDKFGFDGSVIYSSSSAKIIYPWDEVWDNCKNFKFEY